MNIENIHINSDDKLKKTAIKLGKELQRFAKQYGKILALSMQKEIEINLILADKLEISQVNRLINIKTFEKINIDELSMLIKNKIVNILEKDKVFVPDYIKEQINNSFDMKKKIKKNEIETNDLLKEITKNS